MKFFCKILILILSFTFLKVDYFYAQDLIKDDLVEYNNLNDSVTKYRNTDLRLAIEYAKKQLSIAEKAKDTAKIIKALHRIGRGSQFIAEFNQSVEYFEKELYLLKTIDQQKRIYQDLANDNYSEIEVLAQLGQSYSLLGQFKKAMTFYDRCVEITETKNFEYLEFYRHILPSLIADLHFTTDNYKEALVKYKESFKALKSTKAIDEITRINNRSSVAISISDTYLKLNEKDSALWILDESIKEKLDTINLLSQMSFKSQIGRIYLEKKEYDKALLSLKEADKIGHAYDSVIGNVFVSLELAECYLNLKDYDKAIKILKNGIEIKKSRTKEIYLTEDYKLLAKIYKESGDIEKSNEYYEKYIINQTALEKSKDTISSTFHNQEILSLNEVKKSHENRLLLIIGSISMLVLGLSFAIAYLIKERKQNAKKFNELLSKINQVDQPELEIINTKDSVLDDKTTADVNEETTEQILNGLKKLKEQQYFLKKDCNSYNVAKKIKTNTSYLSKVINSHFEKNFNTYINDLRINYAIVQLKKDTRFRSFSVQSIAEELGYKSADSFTKYFKLRTGLNPSFYIKQLNSLT